MFPNYVLAADMPRESRFASGKTGGTLQQIRAVQPLNRKNCASG